MRLLKACFAGIAAVAAVVVAVRGGPVMDENPTGLDRRRQEVAAQEWAASTNALTSSNFVAAVEAARNWEELKGAILRKARSDDGLDAATRKVKGGKDGRP